MSYIRDTGCLGEEMAAGYLQNEGYTILERNYLKKAGELDLVARKGSLLIFVEVKTRNSLSMGTPASAVDLRKRERIIKGAKGFLFEHPRYEDRYSMRFDVIEIFPKKARKVNHIINAFEVE